MTTPKFHLGQVSVTPGVLDLRLNLMPYIARHIKGDWGDLCPEDWQANELALTQESRLFSVYQTENGRIWIITEADRRATTILLPEEY